MIEEIVNKKYKDTETGLIVDFAAPRGVCLKDESGHEFVYGVETAVSPDGDAGYLVYVPAASGVHKSVIENIAKTIGFYVAVCEP
jgi:hypothetical protein